MTKLNVKFALILSVSVVAATLAVYFIHGWQMRRNSGDLILRIENLVKEGNLNAAKGVLKQYLRLQPESREQRVKLCKVAYELTKRPDRTMDDLRDAWSLMEDTVRRFPDELEVRKDLVAFLVEFELWNQAIDHLRIVVESQTQDTKERAKAQYDLARCQIRAGEAQSRRNAIASLHSLIGYDPKTDQFDLKKARYPHEPEAYDLLVFEYRRDAGQAKLADRTADQMVIANPKSHEAYLRRGGHYLATNRPELARADIEKARQLQPDDVNVTLTAARISRFDGKFEDADKLLDEVMRKNPKDTRVYQERVQLWMMLGNIEKAQQILDEGLKAIPDDLVLQWQKCRLLVQLNQREKAHSLLNTLGQKLKPELIEPLRAHLIMVDGNVVDAARRFETIRPRLAQMKFGAIGGDLLPQTLLSLSHCYAQMGQLDRQQEALEAVRDLNPKFIEPTIELAKIHLAQGREEEAGRLIDDNVFKIAGAERFWKMPAAWNLKLQVENRRQLRLPESQRNWARVDRLITLVAEQSGMDALATALLRIENMLVRENAAEARKLVDAELKKHNATQVTDRNKNALLVLALHDCTLLAQEKSVEEAIARLDDIQAKFGDSLMVRQKRAQLVARRGGPTVTQELAKLEENVPAHEQIPTWRLLASFHEATRSPDDARRLYEQILKQQPHDLGTHMALFELAHRMDDEPRMIEAIKNVEQLCGRESSERAHLEATRLMRLAAKAKEAERLLEAGGAGMVADETTPKSVDTPDRLYDDARALLKQAQVIRPKWHLPPRFLAQIAFQEDDLAGGLKLMEESLRLGPADAQAVTVLTQLYGRQGDMASARRSIGRLRESERTPDLRKAAAQLELMAGNKEEAVRQAADIMADLEKGGVASADYLWHANLLNQCGKPKEATAAHRKAVERNPQDQAAWITFVQHLMSQREVVQATDVIREAELALPEDVVPIISAECLRMVGKLDAAERLYLELLRGMPDNTTLLRALAQLQMQKRDSRDTARYLDRLITTAEKASAKDPNIPWARRTKANLLAATQDYASFKQACELIEKNYVGGKPSLADLEIEAQIYANRREKEYVDKAIEKIVAIRKDRGILPVGLNFALAALYNQSGAWPKCQEELRSLYIRTKQNPQLLAAAIDLFLDHNELDGAQTRLEDLGKLQPNSFDYIRRQARYLSVAGKPQEAVALLMRLVPAGANASLTDDQINAIRALAVELEQIKQYDAAEKLYRRAAEIRAPEKLALAGFLARRGGQRRIDEALNICDGELQNVRYELLLSVAADATRPAIDKPRPTAKQLERLAQWHQKAENFDPSSVLFKLRKAEFLDLQGLHTQAADIYRELLGRADIDKNQRGLVLNNLAFLLVLSDGDLNDALKHIGESMDILGPNSDLRDTRALVLWRQQQTEEAMKNMHLAIEGGASAAKYFHRALVYQQAKNLDAAAKDFKEALKLRLNKDDLTEKERQWYDQLFNDLKRNGLVSAIAGGAPSAPPTR
jgi:tetratricopeptide (TPR) repeat protein